MVKTHLTWVGISSAVHIQSMEKEADTQKLEGGGEMEGEDYFNICNIAMEITCLS